MEQIFYLLGNPRRSIRLVDDWIDRSRNVLRESRANAATPEGAASLFDYGCALLYDSRLHGALGVFEEIARSERPCDRILARIGHGYSWNLLHQYQAADFSLASALTEARSAGGGALEFVAECFYFLNRSDWGREVSRLGLGKRELEERTELADQLALFRSYVNAMHFLRGGPRESALQITASAVRDPGFAGLGPILRGEILRIHGILLSITNNRAVARDNILKADKIFRNFGYRLGQVRSALGLARLYTSTDQRQAEEYLDNARLIIEDARPPLSGSLEERHMPREWATLCSCDGDLERARGNLEKAISLYNRDLEILKILSGTDIKRDFPRAGAYAHRNLGRAFSAKESFTEGARHFLVSAELFEATGDAMNAFISMVGACDSLLEEEDLKSAEGLLKKMNDILSGQTCRKKENAMVDLMWSRLVWLKDEDVYGALRGVDRAETVFLRSRDYYYVRTLTFKAELLSFSGDRQNSRKCLLEAHRVASCLELGFLVKRLEVLLGEVGASREQMTALAKTDLERQCDLKGFCKTELTVMFADLRGFTDCCLNSDADVIAEFIGEFTDEICRYTVLRRGKPVRFLGDCVMSIYGVHGKGEGKESSALRAACEIYDRFGVLRRRWSSRASALGKIGLGFGLATGTVVAGHFGKKDLAEFSVIGDSVNLAARLQGAAGDGEIFMCPATAESVRNGIPQLDGSRRERKVELKGFGSTSSYQISVHNAKPFLNQEDTGEILRHITSRTVEIPSSERVGQALVVEG